MDILLEDDVHELDELDTDLDERMDNECKNEETQSDLDNSGEDERVSVGSKRRVITHKSLNENLNWIEKNYYSISPPDLEENSERKELTDW